MNSRFEPSFEQFRHVALALNCHDPKLSRLLDQAFDADAERSGDAIRRIERDFDAGLAAIAWGFFWIRQNDFPQARNELETFARPGKARSLWDGMALHVLGEICLELGETKRGAQLIRLAQKALEPAE